jgi:fatty-acyl-CoA synthase
VKGLMGSDPLTIRMIFDRMTTIHGDATVTDPSGTRTYREVGQRVLRLVSALRAMGINPGDRVASFATNTTAHLELYYAIPLAGAVLHMSNIRLHPDQLAYTFTHAGTSLVFAEPDLVERLPEDHPRVITLDDEYETLLAAHEPATQLPELAEDDASAICYTSGTTGMPKAVVYSHRGTYLHALAALAVDHLAISQHDTVMPVVPLFHACGWGLPYVAPLTGAALVLPGADTGAEHLAEQIARHRVTFAAGVPTIWMQMLQVARSGNHDLSSLRTLGVGGSATPRPLLAAWDELGVEILQIWGMTETTPLACTSRPRRSHVGLDAEALRDVRVKTGTLWAGVQGRIVDEAGLDLPWDGRAVGELEVRGPWTATGYFDDPALGERFHDGWLRTGDMAIMEPDGYLSIVDRAKDLVKSGGEWISSVELESAVLGHPQVREAAVVAVRSERWDERPVVVLAAQDPADPPTLAGLREFLEGQVARWWLPDAIVVVDEVAKTSVGKFDKKVLRVQAEQMVGVLP